MLLRKRAILWMILTFFVISGATILFFGATIRTMQEDFYTREAADLARTAALCLDQERILRLREAVQEIYDQAEPRISNAEFEDPAYEDYLARFSSLEENEDHLALVKRLRDIQAVNHVDCVYLLYMDVPTEALIYLADSEEEDPCLPGSFDRLDGDDYLTIRQPERGFGPTVSNTDAYGWVAGTGMPVFDDDGHVIAYVGVDVSMTEITAQRNRMLLNTALSVLLMIIVLGAVSFYASGYFLKRRDQAETTPETAPRSE